MGDFIRANPSSRKVIEAYERQRNAPRNPPDGVERDKFGMPWERRWRWLSERAKLSYLPEFKKMMQKAEYGLRTLGDAHAHARPAALQWFAKMRKTNDFRKQELRYVVNPSPRDFLYSKEYVAFEACLLIIVSCDQVIDVYHLDRRLSKRLKFIYDRLRALSN